MRNTLRAVLVSLLAFAVVAVGAASLVVLVGAAAAPRLATAMILLAIGGGALVLYELVVVAPLALWSAKARAYRTGLAVVVVSGSWLPILLVSLVLRESEEPRTLSAMLAYVTAMPGEFLVWLVPYAVSSGVFAWRAASPLDRLHQPAV